MSTATATGTEVRTLAVYDRISDPMAAIAVLGRDIAHSQMFGCSNEEQGRVLAMTCFAKRMDPLALAERYHLIKGKLSMRADAMLAGLHERGGNHRIIQRTADAAEIEITVNGDSQRFAFTWEEAKQEPFVYGKEKNGKRPLKDNWATPRSRMQMLWARVVSDGVRAMCPEVVCGSYAPEEIADMNDNGTLAGTVVIESQVEDGDQVETEQAETEYPPFDTDGYATGEQAQQILQLFADLQVPHEAQEAALQKRGANSIRSLKQTDAAELIVRLQAKLDQSLADPEARSMPTDGPATQPQIDQVKQLIAEVAQNGQPDIAKRVKAKLESHGLAKLADLSMAEIGRLHAALAVRNLEAFFASSLAGHQGQQKN